MGPGSRARAIALLATGMLVVHQLRFMLAFGGDAHRHLEHGGHAYLGFVLPIVGVALALTCAHFALLLGRSRRAHRAPTPPRFPTTWAAASATLVLAYATQEGVEGTLALGHPAGLAGIFGSGGWIAVPVSLLVGAAVALLLHGAGVVLALAGRRCAGHSRRRSDPRRRPELRVIAAPRNPLACHLSGRAPPLPAL
jgi:hypothetical protein